MYNLLKDNGLNLITNQEETSFEEFKQYYEWSYHFINNRSFGYTDEYTLIPTFDMINHSSRNGNVRQLLSHLGEPGEEAL